jgi:hypothetical protein
MRNQFGRTGHGTVRIIKSHLDELIVRGNLEFKGGCIRRRDTEDGHHHQNKQGNNDHRAVFIVHR